MISRAENYRQLVEQFLQREISAAQFEAGFLDRFKNERKGMPESLFSALDRLFGDVDMFCGDEGLREDHELDEDALRQACERTLTAIAELS